MRRTSPPLILFFALLLAACGREGMAVAPELIARDAVTARAFGNDECFISFESSVPAYLNPNPEQPPVGEAVPGENEAVQAVTLNDGSLWYQMSDGIWVRADTIEYTARGDCRP